jgi:glutaredoxin
MNITIFSTTTCSTCHVLTEWLDKEGLSYIKKEVDTDPIAMAEFMGINDGMVGVPFTVIDKEDGEQTKFSGYDIGALRKLLQD